MLLESRMDRLRQQRRTERQRQDRWFGRLTEGLVITSLLYLLARSPVGRTWLEGAAQLLARQ